MFIHRTFLVVLPAAILISGTAVAEPAGASPTGLDAVSWFTGRWSCEGQAAMPNAAPVAVKADVEVSPVLSNLWLRYDLKQRRSAQNPHPLELVAFWSFEPTAKVYSSRAFDNHGSFTLMHSPGLQGGKIVFTGDSETDGKKMPFRASFTHRSAHEVFEQFEIGLPDGKWIEVLHETCRR